jgi:hypothetical protein
VSVAQWDPRVSKEKPVPRDRRVFKEFRVFRASRVNQDRREPPDLRVLLVQAEFRACLAPPVLPDRRAQLALPDPKDLKVFRVLQAQSDQREIPETPDRWGHRV